MSKEHRKCCLCHIKHSKMFRCTQCKITFYCSIPFGCQHEDRKEHKKMCEELKLSEEFIHDALTNECCLTIIRLHIHIFCKRNNCNAIKIGCSKNDICDLFSISESRCYNMDDCPPNFYYVTYNIPLEGNKFGCCPMYCNNEDIIEKESDELIKTVIERCNGHSGVIVRYYREKETCDAIFTD